MRDCLRIIQLLLWVIVVSFFAVPVLAEELSEEPFHIPGTFSGTGTFFEVTDSEYLDIKLESNEAIRARIESAPEMVVLEVEAVNSGDPVLSTLLTLSGFQPDTEYHKYQDDYSNYEPFTTDGEGSFSFVQDISERHAIFIQPRKSTKFIRDNATGGDCSAIGNWDATTKTCTLTQNVNETIQISNNNITLDGNGNVVSGTGTGSGILLNGTNNSVKNVTVSNFTHGINLPRGGSVAFSSMRNNAYGIYASAETAGLYGVSISNNTVSGSRTVGIYMLNMKNNLVFENIVESGQWTGILQLPSSHNSYENNKVFNNLYYGMSIKGDYNILRGNEMYGNARSNFSLDSPDMTTNEVETDNTVEGKPIIYEKNVTGWIYENSSDIGSFFCSNCENITLRNLRLPEKEPKITLWNTHNSLVEKVTSPDKSIVLELRYSNGNTARNNDLGGIGVYYSHENAIYDNNIMSIYTPAMAASAFNNLFDGNYWEVYKDKCKDSNNDNVCDKPYVAYSWIVDNRPWAREFEHEYADDPLACRENCYSSVLFLPGHQASRLYRKGLMGNEDRLWEPNWNQDVRQLYLDPDDGTSIDPAIYTRDAIDEAFGFADNVYKKFMTSMDEFVGEGTINEWSAFPYDWRLPLEEIVDNGTKLEDGSVADVLDRLREMAKNSKSGKVTIIGHSNGGLLAKVIIDRLEKSGEDGLVDRLIMVGTPQIGTPKAMAGLLHGDGLTLAKGFLLNKKTARGFGENMASAYNLLPSKEYFKIVQSPVVEFDEDVNEIYDFRAIFGEVINDWDGFKKFLLGDDGARTEPDEADTDSPNVLKDFILAQSEATHEKLDSWQAPGHMEVIQIAGWGLDTVRGIRYDDCDILFCPDNLSNLDRKLILTEDGDETVVVPSAVFMGGGERYYLNVKEHNKELIFNLRRNRSHADILEVEPLQNFIKNAIKGNKTLENHIYSEKPEVKDEDKRLRYRLHSPVKIDITDENGNHTGIIESDNPASDILRYEQQVPNSYYMEFGETKYVGSEGNIKQTVLLEGEDLGTFTFEIDEVFGTGETENTTFENIPVMVGMKAKIEISDSIGEMRIDFDGDGENDAIIRPGEEISKETSLEILEKMIGFMDIHETTESRLINKIGNARKQFGKGHVIAGNAMLANVEQEVLTFSRKNIPEKFRILEEEAEKLIVIIGRIIAMK